MNIQFKGTNYEITPDIQKITTRKLESLQKFLGKRDTPALAYVDLGKITQAHVNGNVWYADIHLTVDGISHYAKAESDSIRTAVDTMIGELNRELRVAKKKRESILRKEGNRFKNLFRFGV